MNKNLILVADDEEEIRNFLYLILTDMSYNVELFSNGQELVDGVKKLNPSIIITDLAMPVKDGAMAIMELKDLNPQLITIAMTAIPHKDVKKVTNWIGANYLMKKPLTYFTVIDTMYKLEQNRKRSLS